MNKYKNRLIEKKINQKLKTFGGVLIQGARGVGKTTTSMLFSKSSIRLDTSEKIQELASIAPTEILSGEVPRLIDEWQIVPSIWNVVRSEIDNRNLKGQFILSGSAAPTDSIIRHSGSMRISKITIKTMSLAESEDSANKVNFVDLFKKDTKVKGLSQHTFSQYVDLIIRGGWPQLTSNTPAEASDAIKDYVNNLATIDLRTLNSKPNPKRMSSLIKALSRNVGTTASYETLSRESNVRVERHTIRKYLDQLSQAFILDELLPWKTHIRSSVQKKLGSKWYFLDPSVPAAALSLTNDKLKNDPNALGFFFESLALRDIRIYADYINAETFYFQDSKGLDVDAIVDLPDGSWSAFEIKLGGEKGIKESVNNFNLLKKRLDPQKWSKLRSLNIVIAGNTSYTRPDGINVISLGHLYAK